MNSFEKIAVSGQSPEEQESQRRQQLEQAAPEVPAASTETPAPPEQKVPAAEEKSEEMPGPTPEQEKFLAEFREEVAPYEAELQKQARKGFTSLYEMLPHDDSKITEDQVKGLIGVTEEFKRFFPAVHKRIAKAIVEDKLYKLELSEFIEKCMTIDYLAYAMRADANGMAMTQHINRTVAERNEQERKIPYNRAA